MGQPWWEKLKFSVLLLESASSFGMVWGFLWDLKDRQLAFSLAILRMSWWHCAGFKAKTDQI